MRRLCLVCDLDDTLYLERDYARSGFQAAGAWLQNTLGVSGFGSSAWVAFERGVRGNVFDEALKDVKLVPSRELVDSLVSVYRTHVPDISLLDDSMECLTWFRPRANLAMITDGYSVTQLAKCRALGILPLFDPLIVNETPERHKPDPRSFQSIVARFGSRDVDYAYVGDNPAQDYAVPNALGWKTVRVRRPGSLHYKRPNGPDAVPKVEVNDLSNLFELLLSGE